MPAASLIGTESVRASTEAVGHASQFELRARWSVFHGPFQKGGKLILRQLDAGRVSVMVDLPDQSWLPDRQFLLREGESLLHWQDPEGARSLLDQSDLLKRILEDLPPAGTAALLTGRGLPSLLTEVTEERRGAWTILNGRLAGMPAELRLGINKAWAMDWRLPEGVFHFRWRDGSVGSELTLLLPEGYKVRLFSRLRDHLQISQEDWLFLSD